jgi:hypothetical protein
VRFALRVRRQIPTTPTAKVVLQDLPVPQVSVPPAVLVKYQMKHGVNANRAPLGRPHHSMEHAVFATLVGISTL